MFPPCPYEKKMPKLFTWKLQNAIDGRLVWIVSPQNSCSPETTECDFISQQGLCTYS